MGFDYIVKVALLLSHCGFFFVFGCKVSFFFVGSYLFFDGCSAVSCDFCVIFMRGGKFKSFYSMILSIIEGLLLV